MAEMAYTLMPEPNQTYLVQTKNVVVPADPLSGSTMGFMMILSTFQYNPTPVNPTYAGAVSQASRAAFIEEGGQDFQNKLTSYATKNGIDIAHSVGLTDTEMGVVGFGLRTYQRKQLNVNGPKFYGIKSNLTLAPTNGNIGFKYEW
jgi:hypothetical protein